MTRKISLKQDHEERCCSENMEIGFDAAIELAPNQIVNSHSEWHQKSKEKIKFPTRMAAFPGSAVKFPRCRLKLEQEEAKKMKERLSSRKSSREGQRKQMSDGVIKHEDDDNYDHNDSEIRNHKPMNGKIPLVLNKVALC